eukprot:TRINITY_DN2649_c0_g1_i1.p1 TRINITY_DN2649_c0_g1~~TRINITY_DN2649_c0_g1_i1.p1  ORF type:complete len:433 (+),score=50.02 TRINITY_DN2649_c0_g1_i1:722-2020(+)
MPSLGTATQASCVLAVWLMCAHLQVCHGYGEPELRNATRLTGTVNPFSTEWMFYRINLVKPMALQVVVAETSAPSSNSRLEVYLQSATKPEAENYYQKQTSTQNLIDIPGITQGFMVGATSRIESASGRWFVGVRAVANTGVTADPVGISFAIEASWGGHLCGYQSGLTFCKQIEGWRSLINPDPTARDDKARLEYERNNQIGSVRNGKHCDGINANWTCVQEFGECDADGFPLGICPTFCSDWATECLDSTYQSECLGLYLGSRTSCTGLPTPPPGIGTGVIIAITISAVIIVSVILGGGIGWWRHKRMRRELEEARQRRRASRGKGRGKGRGGRPAYDGPVPAFHSATVVLAPTRPPPPAATSNEAAGIPYGMSDADTDESSGSNIINGDSESSDRGGDPVDVHFESPNTPTGLPDDSSNEPPSLDEIPL